MSKADDLRDAFDAAKKVLIEKGWTQGYYARNAKEELVSVRAEDACAFCAAGALMVAMGHTSRQLRYDAFDILESVTPDHNVAIYNDASSRTKEDILALFDRAKEQCGE